VDRCPRTSDCFVSFNFDIEAAFFLENAPYKFIIAGPLVAIGMRKLQSLIYILSA
jgi:hypothetical protein